LAKAGIFPFATVSRLAQGPTQPPIQWALGALPWGKGGKVAAVWSWSLTSIYCQG